MAAVFIIEVLSLPRRVDAALSGVKNMMEITSHFMIFVVLYSYWKYKIMQESYRNIQSED
tara:strand:+ start:2368 stop:2547 length:180 start_codon:yes stop_codon:yes gene_type:complete